MGGLFLDEDEFEGSGSIRCTPEALLEFLSQFHRKEHRSPTLRECKEKFGGILGPIVCAWELEARGLARNGVPIDKTS